MKLALISCGKRKRSGKHLAKDLYSSHRFQIAWDYAKRTHDAALILSAKHGLLDPYRTICSYDLTLSDLSKSEREAWALKVARQICDYSPEDAEVTFLCGQAYCEGVAGLLGKRRISMPLKGLRIGHHLRWYRKHLF